MSRQLTSLLWRTRSQGRFIDNTPVWAQREGLNNDSVELKHTAESSHQHVRVAAAHARLGGLVYPVRRLSASMSRHSSLSSEDNMMSQEFLQHDGAERSSVENRNDTLDGVQVRPPERR